MFLVWLMKTLIIYGLFIFQFFIFHFGCVLGIWIVLWMLRVKSTLKICVYYYNLDLFRVLLLNQNRKAACGRHKEEVLSQLRELAKSEPLELDTEQHVQSGNLSTGFERDLEADMFPSYEVKLLFHGYKL